MKKIFVYSMLLALLSAVPTEIEAKRYAKSSMRTKTKTERNVSKSNVEKQGNDDYVDLGLPSGTLWATKNIGASSPEGYGNYYAWGETSPKSSYTRDNYTGEDITSDELPAGRDAATANWGSDWRMPSIEQIKELVDGCKWTWTSRNGVNGQLGRSMYNNKTIFLPAAGYRYGASLYDAGSYGNYWSRTRYDSGYAYGLGFKSGGVDYGNGYYYDNRYDGHSVRAVRVSQH